MQLDNQVGVEDIAAFSLHHARNSKRERRRVRITQASGILSSLVLVIVWPNWSVVERVVFFIVSCLLMLIAYPAYYKWAIKRNARSIYSGTESNGILGAHTIIVDAEAVTERSAVGESRIAWSGLERIEDDGDYIYLYIGPLQAYVIPKRAFRTADDQEAFMQLVHAYRLAGVPHDAGPFVR